VLRAIRDAYGTFLRSDRYPAGVIHLIVPPAEVDVNVHPQKAEVRYRAAERVFAVVRQAIGVALRVQQSSSSFSAGVFAEDESALQVSKRPAFPIALFESAPSIKEGQAIKEEQVQRPLNQYRFVGQIFNCYLLMEDSESGNFAIVDMHAAHERVTFARLKRAWSEGEVISQQLLIPESVRIGSRSDSSELLSLLEAVGFEVESLGDESLVVRAVPSLLARFSAKRLVEDLCAELTLEGALERKIDAVISRLACHGSVRSGRELEQEEVYQLLSDLESTELRAFCPHGRSVARVLSSQELERLFGRVQ
jgi:DNA mismatch repair protein MutL